MKNLRAVLVERRVLWWIVFLCGGMLFWQASGAMRTGFVLDVGFETPIHEAPKLYFDEGQGYNEQDSVVGVIKSGGSRALFRLPHENSRGYRLDPPARPALQAISQPLLYSDNGWRLGAINLSEAKSSVQTELVSADAGVLAYNIVGQADDPQLLLPPITIEAKIGRGAALTHFGVRLLLVLLLAGAITLIVDRLLRPATSLDGMVVMGLAVALTVVFAFAVSTSTEHAHNPDEVNHAAAAQYYVGNALPPRVLDPAVTATLSVYGMSYLNELDVVYWMAGRMMHYVSSDRFIDLSSFRMFNVGLLGLLLLVAWLAPRHRLPLAVLLLTPQAWYLYAYFNADALPLTAGLLATILLIPPNSQGARFISEGGRPFWPILILIVLLGILFVSKRNYLPLLPLLGLWLIVRHLRMSGWWAAMATVSIALVLTGLFLSRVPAISAFNGHLVALISGAVLSLLSGILVLRKASLDRTLRRPLGRIAAIFIVSLLFALPRFAYDIHVNGSPTQKSEAILEVAEANARSDLKPSQWLQLDNPTGINLASRGVGLSEVIGARSWFNTTIKSAFGQYGYMDVTQPPWMYSVLQVLFVLFVAGVLYGLLRWSASGGAYAVLGLGFMVIIILNSLLHSWTGDFQPQGRYLLPILGVIAAMLAQAGGEAPGTWLKWFKPVLVVAVIVSAYSILTVAMPGVGFAGNSR